MSAPIDLSVAKKNLQDVIGDDMKIYLQLLKSWFKQRLSREDFDYEARKLISEDMVHLHNQFMLAILSKCQTLGSALVNKESSSSIQASSQSSPKKVKKTSSSKKRSHTATTGKNTTHLSQRFIAANPLLLAPLVNLAIPESDEKGLGYASHEMLLPDIGMVHGRMLVTAWDYGLEKVNDNSVRFLMQAVQLFLKNVLTTVLIKRRSYKVRENNYIHGMGSEVPSTFLRQSAFRYLENSSGTTAISSKGMVMPSIKPSIERSLQQSALEVACAGEYSAERQKITLLDLYEALKTRKCAIHSHTVYATNMESIVNKMWHPSVEELEQEEINKAEVQVKNQLAKEQLMLTLS